MIREIAGLVFFRENATHVGKIRRGCCCCCFYLDAADRWKDHVAWSELNKMAWRFLPWNVEWMNFDSMHVDFFSSNQRIWPAATKVMEKISMLFLYGLPSCCIGYWKKSRVWRIRKKKNPNFMFPRMKWTVVCDLLEEKNTEKTIKTEIKGKTQRKDVVCVWL